MNEFLVFLLVIGPTKYKFKKRVFNSVFKQEIGIGLDLIVMK
jgi:hypothetical protein